MEDFVSLVEQNTLHIVCMWIRQATLPTATIQVNQIVSPTVHYMHSCVVVDRQAN